MRLIRISLIATSITFLMAGGVALAGGSHSSSNVETETQKNMEHSDKGGHDGKGGHAHASWKKSPEEYASLTAKDWDDTSASFRGEKLYKQQCVACHGADGKGTGPVAASLKHPPADLTNNFHTAPGKGDGYLFWRISDGGAVEPFRSMNSAMPAFKDILSEAERWDVLVYVHQEFHIAFPTTPTHQEMPRQHKRKKVRMSPGSGSGHSH